MSPHPEISSRTENLIAAEGILEQYSGAAIPRYVELSAVEFEMAREPSSEMLANLHQSLFEKPAPDLVWHYQDELSAHGLFEMVDNRLSNLTTNGPVIIRCAPVVPETADHLSFAGTYPSFIPKPVADQTPESVHESVASVLAGKHTRYADYYNYRHELGGRRLGVLAMELVEKPAIHGTAYSFDGNIRSEHVFDPALEGEQYAEQYGALHFVSDVYGETDNFSENEFCGYVDFKCRLAELCRALEVSFGYPLDIEYLVDQAGVIHIVQIREISRKHQENWRAYYCQHPEQVVTDGSVERRTIINSVGKMEGNVIFLDPNDDEAYPVSSSVVTVVSHDSSGEFLEGLVRNDYHHDLQILVQHGQERVRDHLQYSMYEDPVVISLVHHADEKIQIEPDEMVTIYSNGDYVRRAVA